MGLNYYMDSQNITEQNTPPPSPHKHFKERERENLLMSYRFIVSEIKALVRDDVARPA